MESADNESVDNGPQANEEQRGAFERPDDLDERIGEGSESDYEDAEPEAVEPDRGEGGPDIL